MYFELKTSSMKQKSSTRSKKQSQQNPRIVYPPVLNINCFRHFLDIIPTYYPMDDEPYRSKQSELKRSKELFNLHRNLLEDEIFAKFDEFMAMTADENSDSESDTKEPPFEKITLNTNYKIKTSLEEPPMDLELKPIHDNLEYEFVKEPSFLPVIISS
nr:reverse transcriptase domain-containing protein [Tanacetum cinerariifolium]